MCPYNRQSVRLKHWDYSSNGYYFVTVCVQNRMSLFGQIVGREIILSEIGEIVRDEWLKTPLIRKHVNLDHWVIMPDHMHGIIIINNDVGAHCNVPLQCDMPQTYKNKFGPQRQNLPSIIRCFKSMVVKRARDIGYNQVIWQRGYYEHIIRSENSLRETREYIHNNPIFWNLES